MSWLSGIAKGAEALLDKVDQTAASALQKEDDIPSESVQIGETNIREPFSNKIHQDDIVKISKDDRKPSEEFVRPLSGSTSRSQASSAKSLPRSSSASSLKTKSDAQLFDFLNSASSVGDISAKKNLPFTSTPIKTKATLNKAVTGTTTSKVQEKPVTNDAPSEQPANMESSVPEKDNPSTNQPEAIKQEAETKDEEDGPLPAEAIKVQIKKTESKELNDRISNLHLENRLLKSEISSLNEELAGALRTVKQVQNDTRHLEEKLEHAQNQMVQQDKVVNGVQEHEKDLTEALKAKDSQLAILRVRIQEADEELKSKKDLIKQLSSENERILKDHSDSTGLQSVALDTFKEKLEERENELYQTKSQQNSAQTELMELRTRLQHEQQQMAESVKSLQLKLNEEKGKTREMEHSLRASKDAAETAQRDLKEYKDKATRILQAKEKLITSLKQGNAGSDPSSIVFTELEEIKQERDMLREELSQLKYKYEQLRVDLLDIEHQSQAESEDQQQIIENLEKYLEDEKSQQQHCNEQLNHHLEEIQLLKEDLQRQKTNTMVLTQERDSEIQRLNNQLTLKSSTSHSQEELENRVHSLTDNLILKQTLIETLSTEKNSLSLQLERLEQQYRDVQQNLTKSNTHLRHNHHIELEEADEGSVTSRSIASIMPSHVTKSRRWKSTVNVIDKFSIRLGVFLRRYPIARLFVIVYVFLLHLWVTIVLLTYQPEIHKNQSKLPNSST